MKMIIMLTELNKGQKKYGENVLERNSTFNDEGMNKEIKMQ